MVTALWRVPPASSFEAIAVRPPTAAPVYTPRVVSKLLPNVLISPTPVAGADQFHQTELIGAEVAAATLAGSTAAAVAPTFVPVAAADCRDGRAAATAKLS